MLCFGSASFHFLTVAKFLAQRNALYSPKPIEWIVFVIQWTDNITSKIEIESTKHVNKGPQNEHNKYYTIATEMNEERTTTTKQTDQTKLNNNV